MTGRAVPTVISFRALSDDPIGSSLAGVFAEYWPAYQRWMRRAEPLAGVSPAQRLRAHMPELAPVFDRLLERFGGGDAVATFLSLYNPPRVVRGCSQIVLDDDGPVLLRSYDHHPALLDDLVLHSHWLDRGVLAMTDCLWGALDGINEHGLAIALAFGGRDAVGPGFAAPLVTRYVLETCASVDEAQEALTRVPMYMPYTFVVVDASGAFVTAYLGPDAPPRFVTRRASTNHQGSVDWPAYCQHTQSVERLTRLETLLAGPSTASDALEAYLTPPLWRRDYAHAAGTLYVAEYRPGARTMTLHWPGRSERFGLDDFQERTFSVDLLAPAP